MDESEKQELREVLAAWYGLQANNWDMNDVRRGPSVTPQRGLRRQACSHGGSKLRRIQQMTDYLWEQACLRMA